MSDPFGQSATQNRYDIEFSVPMTHRLRFTQDCFGDDFHVIAELFEHPGTSPARTQVWIDEGLCNWDSQLSDRIAGQNIFLETELQPFLPGINVLLLLNNMPRKH